MAAGYTLDLYCDVPSCPGRRVVDRPQAQYFAERGATCRRNAKKDGWRWAKDGTAVCPDCSKKGYTVRSVLK